MPEKGPETAGLSGVSGGRRGGRRRRTVHRWAPLALADDYVRLGWLPLPTLAGTPHGLYRVHVAWLCSCQPPEPPPRR